MTRACQTPYPKFQRLLARVTTNLNMSYNQSPKPTLGVSSQHPIAIFQNTKKIPLYTQCSNTFMGYPSYTGELVVYTTYRISRSRLSPFLIHLKASNGQPLKTLRLLMAQQEKSPILEERPNACSCLMLAQHQILHSDGCCVCPAVHLLFCTLRGWTHRKK